MDDIDPRQAKFQQNWDTRPIPDPTVQTTLGLDRAIAALRELVDARLDAMDKAIALLQAHSDKSRSIDVIEQRVMALQSLHQEKFTSVEEQIRSLEKGIQTQFTERDVRTDKMAAAGTDALAAALLAQKDAVAVAFQAQKESVAAQTQASERASEKNALEATKLMDQFRLSLQASNEATADKFSQQTDLREAERRAVDDKFVAMKDLVAATNSRMTSIESQRAGGDRAVTRMGEGWGVVMGVVGAMIGVGGIVAAVAIAIMRGR